MDVLSSHFEMNEFGCVKFKRVQRRLDKSAEKTSESG